MIVFLVAFFIFHFLVLVCVRVRACECVCVCVCVCVSLSIHNILILIVFWSSCSLKFVIFSCRLHVLYSLLLFLVVLPSRKIFFVIKSCVSSSRNVYFVILSGRVASRCFAQRIFCLFCFVFCFVFSSAACER